MVGPRVVLVTGVVYMPGTPISATAGRRRHLRRRQRLFPPSKPRTLLQNHLRTWHPSTIATDDDSHRNQPPSCRQYCQRDVLFVALPFRLAFLFVELLAAFAFRGRESMVGAVHDADATQNFDPSKMDKIWLADRFQKVVTTLNIDLLDLDTISANPCSLIAVASSYTEPLAS